MGVVRKQSSWSTVLTYVGIVIGYINIGFFFPKVLSEEHFGLRSILVEFSMIFGYLATFGVGGTIQKYLYSFSKEGKTQESKFLTTIFLQLVVGLLFSLFLVKFFEPQIISFYQAKSELFVEFLYLCFPLLGIITLNLTFESLLIANNATSVSTFAKEVLLRIFHFLMIMLLHFKFIGITDFWSLYVASYGLVLVFYVLYALYKKFLKLGFHVLAFIHVKSLSEFSFFSLLGSLASMIVLKVDVLMLGGMSADGIRDVAIYAMCILITSVIETPKRILYQVSVPFISKYFTEKDMVSLDGLYKKTSSTMLVIGGGMLLLIWIFLDLFYKIVPRGDFFVAGKTVILILGLAKLVEMLFGANAQVISYSEKYKWSFPLVLGLATLTVFTNWFLIPIYGIEGAAYATLFCYFLINVARSLLVYKLFDLHPFSAKTILGLVVVLSMLALVSLVSFQQNLIFNTILELMVFGGGFVGLMYVLKISPEVNQMLVSFKERII